MEYKNIATDYTGLICKKIDVIDPENDNVIQMQKIKNKNENNDSQSFKIASIIISMVMCVFLGGIVYKYVYNNKRTINGYDIGQLAILSLLSILCFIYAIILLTNLIDFN
jgi:hypothetical protein